MNMDVVLWKGDHLSAIWHLSWMVRCGSRYCYGTGFLLEYWYACCCGWYNLPSARIEFIHLVVCLTTGPKPLPKQALHIVQSRAFSFKWEYSLLSLWSSKSFLRLLPCLPVTSIPPCIFPSVTRCRRQFLRKMWPIQFAFRLRISCRDRIWAIYKGLNMFLVWSLLPAHCRCGGILLHLIILDDIHTR